VDIPSTKTDYDNQVHTVMFIASPQRQSSHLNPWELNHYQQVPPTPEDRSVRNNSYSLYIGYQRSYKPLIHQIPSWSSSSLEGIRTMTGSNDDGYYESYGPFKVFTLNYQQNRNLRRHNVVIGILILILCWIIFTHYHRKHTATSYLSTRPDLSYVENEEGQSHNGTVLSRTNVKFLT